LALLKHEEAANAAFPSLPAAMNQDEVLQWYRDERASVARQIERLSSGPVDRRGYSDEVVADTVDRALADLRTRLLKLDRILSPPAEE
jgi:hypothetical protein